eukprot:6427268-Pyramimonas_sp.AAC.1
MQRTRRTNSGRRALQSDSIGQDTREDTRPFPRATLPQECRKHGSRDTRHKGTLDLAGSTY